MKRLLLSLLFIPFFTSSSWANPEKPSGNLTFEDRAVWEWDYDLNDAADINDVGSVMDNQGEKQSVKQGQQRQSGWRQKPTSIQRKPGGLKRRAR